MNSPKKTLSEQKREAIINAAKHAFKQYGVQATSMDKLAEIAQVSKRTVYNHFETKEALLMYLVAELWQKSDAQVAIAYQSDVDLQDQLTQLLRAEICFICTQEHMDVSKVAIGHYFYNSQALQKEFEKISCQEDAIKRWLNEAKKDKKLQLDDVEFAYEQLLSLIKGGCFWPVLFQLEPSLSDNKQQHLASETAKIFLARYQR